ncbi:hypothetical protein IEQ34_019204 [Dendrobium chrysotoxum]|uniref:Uncharacterized protein n=1 Tax=Dendrobium chrysotoxum TaxID=161865 RepID=A0AAV7FQM5_DENCH|nr:hypothetical protein IEQ34_019204 [Dendrobium chrysotoxum]
MLKKTNSDKLPISRGSSDVKKLIGRESLCKALQFLISTGIGPLNLFRSNSIMLKLVSLHKSAGKLPVRLLSPSRSCTNDLQVVIPLGIPPTKLFWYSASVTKLVQLPNSLGTDPDKSLSQRISSLRNWSFPISFGISPPSWFCARPRTSILSHSLISTGMLMEIMFCPARKITKFLSWPIDGGSAPVRLLVYATNSTREERLPISSGRDPVIVLVLVLELELPLPLLARDPPHNVRDDIYHYGGYERSCLSRRLKESLIQFQQAQHRFIRKQRTFELLSLPPEAGREPSNSFCFHLKRAENSGSSCERSSHDEHRLDER